MRKSRFTEAQIVTALRQAEAGTPVAGLTLDKDIIQEALGEKR